ITVNAVNDPPVAANDAATTDEDTPVNVLVLGNDNDVDDGIDAASVAIVTNAANGSAVVEPDGSVTYSPAANFNGGDSFSYTVNDNTGATSNVATVSITVNAVNDPPVSANDAATTNEDTPVNVLVLANDSDVDDGIDASTVVIVTNLANGSAVVEPDGSVTYSPAANFNGSDSFSYTVNDNAGATSNIATVNITVNAVNDPPVAANDAATTDEDTPVNVFVLANDNDVDDGIDAASVAIVTNAPNGSAVVEPDGSVTYSPAADFNGTDSFTYTVNDNAGATSNVATVSITVTAVNDPPVAANDAATTDEDTPVNVLVLGNDNDVDDGIDASSVAIVSSAANGSAVVEPDGSVTYSPVADFNGTDSFSYTVNDNAGLTSNVATVSITVTAVNDPPVAANDAATTDEDTPVNVLVLANDNDVDDGIDVSTVVVVSNGNAVLEPDGSVTYTPVADFNGTDSFTYTVNDNAGATSNVATVSITVTAVNDPPVAANDAATTDEDTPVNVLVLGNDNDVDDGIDAASVAIVSNAANGSAVVEPDGSVTYTPAADFNGTDSFSYTVNDNAGVTSNVATVSITVSAVNDPPLVANQTFAVDENTPNQTAFATVAANDADGDALTYAIVAGVPNNEFEINATSGELLVGNESELDFETSPSFTITVTVDDGTAPPAEAAVTININDVNEPVNAFGGNIGTTTEDAADSGGAGSVGVNDTDDDGTTDFVITQVEGNAANVGQQIVLTSGALLTVNADRSYTYDPNGRFETLTTGDSVDESFTYTISDGEFSSTGTAFQTVTGVNDAPDDPVISTIRINNGDTLQINTFLLRTTDVDTADSGITYDLTAVPTDGGLLLSGTPLNVGESFTQADLAAGTVDYLNETQPTGGQDSFSFNLSNGGAASNPNGPFTFTIDVTPPNNRPQATVPAQPIVGNITTRTAINGLAVSDPDEGSGFESSEVEVVLTTTEAIGAFNVIDATEGGLNFVGDSNFTDTVTIRGSLADINATFSTPGAVGFTPPFKRSGLFELSLTIDDLDPRGPLANTQTQDLLLNIFSLNEANTTIAGQIPDGNLGRTATNVGDINGDGFDDIAMVQDNASQREVIVFYGASEPFNASPAGADGKNGFVVTSTLFSTSERFGEAVIGHDVDRDGFNDLIIGDPGADLASIDTDDGRVYVLFGSATIPAFNDLSDEEPGTIRYEVLENNDFDQVGAEIGTALAVGDIDGDAFPDLLVGAPGAFNAQSESLPGAVFVLFGDAETGTNFTSPPISGLEPDLAILGPQTGDGFGSAVDAGDVNGDAIDDLIVGAPTATRQGVSASGSVYAVAGRDRAAFGSQQVVVNSLLDNPEDGFEYQGSNDANGELGGSVAFADDINGDGFGDFIVGEPGVTFDPGDSSTRRGMAHVLFGTNMNPDPATIPGGYFRGELDGSNGYFVFPPASEASFFGDSVGGGGDINGDGLRDVIIGYPAFAATGISPQDGTAYLLFGGTPDASSLDLSGLDGRNGFVIESEEPGANDDRTGEMVTTLGDFNGDGFDDLLVSVPLVDTPVSAAGRVHVINGDNFLGLNMTIGDDQSNALPASNTFIIAGDGNDSLGSLSANSVLRGGRGNDNLEFTGDILADGGSNDPSGEGVDMLAIGSEDGNPARINYAAVPRHQRARNIELISLGDTALAVDALEVQSLTDGRNTLRVDGTGNPANAVVTDDAWQPGQIVDIGGTQYQQYFSGGATLLVDVNVDRSGIILAAQTVLLSRTSNDTQNDQPSTRPRVSGNGQYVVFESSSSTTDDNGVMPTAGVKNVYRKSLDTDMLEVVTTDGMSGGNNDSEFACVSHSGNLLAFATTATNLPTTRADNGNSVTVSGRQVVLANLAATPNPTFEIVSGLPSEGFIQFASVGNECEFSPDERYVYFVGESGGGTTPSTGTHIWRYDIATGSGLDRTAVSYDADTEFSYCESDGETSFGCQGIGVSADGSVVAFAANADFPGDTNPQDFQAMQSGYDIVIRDANQGGFEIAANGALGTTSTRPSLSGDGQLLVFESDSDFSGEGTASADIYLLDRVSGVFSTVNTDPNGLANGDSAFGSNPNPDGVGDPRISTDGRFVVFTSRQDGLDGAAYPTPEPGPSFSTFVKRVPATLPSVDGGLQSPIFRAHRNLLGDFFSTFDGESINNPAVGRTASINFDGRAIVFSDTANNIVSSDTNGQNADVFAFLNPLFEDDFVADLDGDGLSNQNELANLQTNPANTDTDGDRLKDNVEVGFAGDPSVYDIGGDTDPTNPDTDGDLLGDGLEFELTGAELTSVVGSGADPIIFVSDDADGTGDGTGYGLDALTVAQAAIRTDNGISGNPVIFVFEEGFYSSIPNLTLDSRNDVALIGSMAPGRLYPREDSPSTSLRVNAQRGQRMLTIDSSSNITVRSIEIAFSRPPAGVAGGALAVLGTQTPSSNILLRSIQLQFNDTIDVGGGGLAVLNGSDAVLENSTVSRNDVTTSQGANLHGGGILVATGSRLDIINSSVTDNTLDESSGDGGITFGGGLAVMGGSTVAVLDSVVSQNGNNSAAADVGGGIYVASSSISVENTEISDNVLSGNSSGTIPGYGGGVYLDAIGTADFINAKILRNQALGELDVAALGGGVALANGGELNVTDSLISGNRATAQGTSSSANGGGIYSGFSGNNVKIVGSIISDNVAESDGFNARGGGFYTNSSGTLSIQDSQFLGNAAPSAGGGIWISDGGNFGTDMTVLNNLFTGNVSGSGGGIWARQLSTQGNNLLLQNNTVAYNQVVQASAGGGINVASSTGSTLSVLDNIVVANDDNSVGTSTADENYTGPVVTAAPDVLIDYNLNADQAIGDNAFAPATNPQWLQGFYLGQAGNPLVGLILGAGGGGDETRTTSNLGHPGLLPNDLAFTVTTSVLGVFDGGNDQKQDNLDIGYHHLQASAGALTAVTAVDPGVGDTLFCDFSQEFGNSAAITVRPRVGTLESQQGRLISARSLTPGAALRSRTQLDPLGAGDSVLAVDRGNGSYTVFFDGNASFVNPGSPVTLEFFEDVPGNSLGTLTYVTDSGFSCGS
ncbi:tandem-95 repeat protein, partial [bacterium]|nr:tandem-95 repeat protein [bacterium]